MLIKVKVHPKAGKDKIVRKGDDSFEVWVREPAERGRANAAVVFLLAEFLRLPAGKIRLIRGKSRPNKIFDVLQYNFRPSDI